MLNRYYSTLGDGARARFHERYAKIFRDNKIRFADGRWRVQFGAATIFLPLREEWSWLDWDAAVSIVGHDIEIKQTYLTLIESDRRPHLFLDIGANYGTHSILFLSAGIPAMAFEPNAICRPYFEKVCDMNGLVGCWEQVAIGNTNGEVDLVYPETETWCGSISPETISVLRKGAVATQRVPLKKIDEYIGEISRTNVLIKIDVEGHENEVLQGASELLGRVRPTIIFESSNEQTRKNTFELLAAANYDIHRLPFRGSYTRSGLTMLEFCGCRDTNFIAMPRFNDHGVRC
jgi:FkbM family methyltransferase